MDFSQLKTNPRESPFPDSLTSPLEDSPQILDHLELKQKNQDLLKQIQDLKSQILQVILTRVKRSFVSPVLIV